MPRRKVHLSERFLVHARECFPPGGSADGRPSFEQFRDGPLQAANLAFERDFDDQLIVFNEGIAVRAVATTDAHLFPALVFFAILDTEDVVEIVDFDLDEDYWDLVGDDPE
jgi:hypothetical protein